MIQARDIFAAVAFWTLFTNKVIHEGEWRRKDELKTLIELSWDVANGMMKMRESSRVD